MIVGMAWDCMGVGVVNLALFKAAITLPLTPHWAQPRMGLGQPLPRTLMPSRSMRMLSTSVVRGGDVIGEALWGSANWER